MRLSLYIAIGAAIVAFRLGRGVNADEGCCHHCGCQDGCEKVCRLVREDKKVNVVCWGCQCEEFCAPGKSHPGCKNCEIVCEDCDPAVAHEPKKFVWFDWEPGDSKHIYTKKKLMRKTVTKTVPSFKWVVEDMCQACQTKIPMAVVPTDATVPPPPRIANVRYLSGVSSGSPSSEAAIVPAKTSRTPQSWLFRTILGAE